MKNSIKNTNSEVESHRFNETKGGFTSYRIYKVLGKSVFSYDTKVGIVSIDKDTLINGLKVFLDSLD